MKRAIDLADSLAGDLLERAGQNAVAPVDICAVAMACRAQIVPLDMPEDGRLVHDSEHARIYVNAAHSEVRQRFTIAHEIAHWSLRCDALTSHFTEETQQAFASEEMLSNTVAGALLLPRGWLLDVCAPLSQRTVRRYSESQELREEPLQDLSDLASAAEVSVEVALIRMREVCGWQSTLLRFQRRTQVRLGQAHWRFEEEAGVFPWERGRAMPNKSTSDSLLAASGQGPRILRRWPVPLVIAGSERTVACDVQVRRDEALALVPPADQFERCSYVAQAA